MHTESQLPRQLRHQTVIKLLIAYTLTIFVKATSPGEMYITAFSKIQH